MSVKLYLNKFPFAHISSHLGFKNIRFHWEWDQFSYPRADLACPLFQYPPQSSVLEGKPTSPINNFLLAATKEAPPPTWNIWCMVMPTAWPLAPAARDSPEYSLPKKSGYFPKSNFFFLPEGHLLLEVFVWF